MTLVPRLYYTLCLLTFSKIISCSHAMSRSNSWNNFIYAYIYIYIYTLLNLPLVPVRAVSSRRVFEYQTCLGEMIGIYYIGARLTSIRFLSPPPSIFPRRIFRHFSRRRRIVPEVEV